MSLKASYETRKDDSLFNVIYRGVFALSANHPENLRNITIVSSDDRLDLGVCAQSQYFHRGKIGDFFLKFKMDSVPLETFSQDFVQQSILRYGGKIINLEFKGDFNFRYCVPDGGWNPTVSSDTPENVLKEAEVLDILGVPYKIEKGGIVVENSGQNTIPLENQARAYRWGSEQGLDVNLRSCSGSLYHTDLEITEEHDKSETKSVWEFKKRSFPTWWGLVGGLNKDYIDNIESLLKEVGIEFGGRTWNVDDSNALNPDGTATFVMGPSFRFS